MTSLLFLANKKRQNKICLRSCKIIIQVMLKFVRENYYSRQSVYREMSVLCHAQALFANPFSNVSAPCLLFSVNSSPVFDFNFIRGSLCALLRTPATCLPTHSGTLLGPQRCTCVNTYLCAHA